MEITGKTADYFKRSPAERTAMAATRYTLASAYMAEFFPICGPESEPFLRGLGQFAHQMADQCADRKTEVAD